MSELLKINVNDHTEKKGGLTYLSWAWAWAEVLKHDPQATWVIHNYGGRDGAEQPCMWVGDTALVHTTVTIKGLARECMLPVMDNRNNAVKNPDARKISDAIMRCMTKAIAMHGLGLYIYAGEDLPEGDEPEKVDGVSTDVRANGPAEAFKSLQPEVQDRMRKLAVKVSAAETPSQMLDILDFEDLDNDSKAGLWSLLDSTTRAAIKKAQKEIAK